MDFLYIVRLIGLREFWPFSRPCGSYSLEGVSRRGLVTTAEVIRRELCGERDKYARGNHQNVLVGNGSPQGAHDFVALLRACAKQKDLYNGSRVHADLLTVGLLEKDQYVASALVSMYAKCGALSKAQDVHDQLPVRNVVTWSALISGYVQHGHGEEALNCFEWMQSEGLSPDAVTFACILKACTKIGAPDKGEKIHVEIVRQGLLGKDLVLDNALVDMYAKCGVLAKAQHVFDELSVRDVVTWSTLIAGYAQHGRGKEALNCFEWMKREGLSPNAVTFTSSLKACSSEGATDKGEKIHSEIVRQGLLEKHSVLGNALVDMYAKCGALAAAQQVLDELPVRSVVTWSALIAGYTQHGHSEEAWSCFERMQCEGLSPNAAIFTCILKACGSIGAAETGRKVHTEIVMQGLLGKDTVLGTALVGMYAKCGALLKAQKVLDELPRRDVVSWSALIAGYAHYGHGEEALICFERMQREGLSPDAVIFACVFNACSHSGLVDAGELFYGSMNTKYGILPDLEHHISMVDLYGRAGRFDKAVTVIKKMPSSDCLPLWVALLGACQKWGNVILGRFAFKHATCLDEKDAAAYICMNNIYAAAGMQEEAEKIEAMRVKNEVQGKPGYSGGVSGNLKIFVSGIEK